MFETSIKDRSSWQRFRDNWSSKQAWRFSCALAVFSGGAVLLWPATNNVLWLLPSTLMVCAGLYFYLSWKACNARLTVAEALQKDPRPPILYLRPFKADAVKFKTDGGQMRMLAGLARILTPGIFKIFIPSLEPPTSIPASSIRGEELLVSMIDPLGPVIAIGRPKEKIPPAGAARLYVGDEWKDVVHDLLNRSQMILLYAGSTPHFEWELRKVFDNDPFIPTVLIFPFFQNYDQAKVDVFLARFFEVTGLHLSRDLEYKRAAYFPHRFEAIEVWNSVNEDEELLARINPFAGAIAHIMEIKRPGWSKGYVPIARDLSSWSKYVMLVAVGFGILTVLIRLMSFLNQ